MTLTAVLAGLTLVATIAAAVPGIVALTNDERANVFYDQSVSRMQFPDSLDSDRILEVMKREGIPSSVLTVRVVNQGNAKAPGISISLASSDPIVSRETVPPVLSVQPWVSVTERKTEDPGRYELLLGDLFVTKVFKVSIGYQGKPGESPLVEVFADGIPAHGVEDIIAVPPWSPWDAFVLPAIVFGSGAILIVLFAIGSSLRLDPELAGRLKTDSEKLLRAVLKVASSGLL